MPGIIGSTGLVRARAWTWLFSSTQSTTALSGGSRYRPTTSNSLSTNSGSLDSLNVSVRCGLRSKAFQIRPIVVLDSPDRLAIDARDQCVALTGVCSNVATTTSSTCSTLIEGGRPGRGSSVNPSRRSATNRARHLPTVAGAQPSRFATVLLSTPSAHANTIFDRSARACDDFARRDQRTNCSRSSSLSTNSALGRPVLAMLQSKTYIAYLRRRTLELA